MADSIGTINGLKMTCQVLKLIEWRVRSSNFEDVIISAIV